MITFFNTWPVLHIHSFTTSLQIFVLFGSNLQNKIHILFKDLWSPSWSLYYPRKISQLFNPSISYLLETCHRKCTSQASCTNHLSLWALIFFFLYEFLMLWPLFFLCPAPYLRVRALGQSLYTSAHISFDKALCGFTPSHSEGIISVSASWIRLWTPRGQDSGFSPPLIDRTSS